MGRGDTKEVLHSEGNKKSQRGCSREREGEGEKRKQISPGPPCDVKDFMGNGSKWGNYGCNAENRIQEGPSLYKETTWTMSQGCR